jgi:purine-binding chemotaxis protein CheW
MEAMQATQSAPAQETPATAAAEREAGAREFLTFTLGEEEYGVDILKVQEIRGCDAVTRLPESPDFIKGVINLRGIIVPIVDMRVKFRLPQAEYNEFTVMIILNLDDRVVGMVVDSVSDVMMLGADKLREPPEFGGNFDTRFITGLGALDDRMLILLDIERLMHSEEMALVSATDDVAQADD